MVKAIIFDVGGVLAADVLEPLFLDPVHGIAHQYGLNIDKTSEVSKDLWDKYSHGVFGTQCTWDQQEVSFWREVSERLSIPYDYDIFMHLTNKFIKPLSGMKLLLQELDNNRITLAICSNNTEFWFERQSKELEIDKLFSPKHIVLSSRVGESKKNESLKMFKQINEVLSLDKRECLFIDDRIYNINMSIRYGLTSIYFPSNNDIGCEYLRRIFVHMKILK